MSHSIGTDKSLPLDVHLLPRADLVCSYHVVRTTLAAVAPAVSGMKEHPEIARNVIHDQPGSRNA
jgi:hypothetical protein